MAVEKLDQLRAEFELFRQQEDHQYRFRFGREVDGAPAEPWSWEDLD
jgi:hypothetical protein